MGGDFHRDILAGAATATPVATRREGTDISRKYVWPPPLGWRLQVKASHPFLQFGNGNVSTVGAVFPIYTTIMYSYLSELRSLQSGLHPGGVACCDRSVEPVSGARMPIRMHRSSILVHFGYSDHWYLAVSIPLLVVLVHFFLSFLSLACYSCRTRNLSFSVPSVFAPLSEPNKYWISIAMSNTYPPTTPPPPRSYPAGLYIHLGLASSVAFWLPVLRTRASRAHAVNCLCKITMSAYP